MTRSLLLTLSLTSSMLLPAAPPPLPKAVTSFGAVACEGFFYVYGGHTGKAHEYSTASVSGALWRLSLTKQDTWEVLPGDVPVQSPATVLSCKAKLIVFERCIEQQKQFSCYGSQSDFGGLSGGDKPLVESG